MYVHARMYVHACTYAPDLYGHACDKSVTLGPKFRQSQLQTLSRNAVQSDHFCSRECQHAGCDVGSPWQPCDEDR